MDDEQILDLFFARDQQAIACTRERYGKRLLALARNILKSQEDAEESENDTYFQTWQTRSGRLCAQDQCLYRGRHFFVGDVRV